MEVYVDLLLVVNWSLNAWSLHLTAYLLGARPPGMRMSLASLLGAIYAMGMFTPYAAQFSHPLSKLAVAAIMVLICFRPQRVAELVPLNCLFLLSSFITAGVVTGLYSLLIGHQTKGHLTYGQLPWWVLILAVAMLSLTGNRFFNFLQNRLVHVANEADLTVWVEGRGIRLKALVDSGNQLAEPLTGRPVVVISLDAISEFLPAELVELSQMSWEDGIDRLAETSWAERLRFIPFRSVANPGGLLLGVRTDRLLVSCPTGEQEYAGAIIGISRHKLSGSGSYEALLPVRLLPRDQTRLQEVQL